MSNIEIFEANPAALQACTISSDVQEFEQLIDAMEDQFAENWGDVAFEDALYFLRQSDSDGLRFVVLAVNQGDEPKLGEIAAIIEAAKQKGLRVILLSDHIAPAMLHTLMRTGADDFLPYPLPEGALADSIARLSAPPPAPPEVAPAAAPAPIAKSSTDREAVVLVMHGMAGGTGATTLASNLAVELAQLGAKSGQRVCLMDLDFQFGNIATYLDLPRRDAVLDLLSEAALADVDTLMSTLQPFKEGLSVLTAPADMVPLEIISPDDLGHLIDMARANFDYVIIDMPTAIVSWTEAVLTRAHVYFAMLSLDLRCAQNVLRLTRALKAEGLPYEKLRYTLNRAPKFTDLSAKSRVKRMAESLDISIELHLPDGTPVVTEANDQGLPLAEFAPKSPLRKELAKLAKSLFDLNTAAPAAQAKR